jgi:hypothetical protein
MSPLRRWWAPVALIAAVPSLVWAWRGSGFLTDDWPTINDLQRTGPLQFFVDAAFRHPARPGFAAYWTVTGTLFGTHPAPYAVAMAVLNAAAAVLVLAVAARLLPARLAVLCALAWAVLPNRGSTRLWLQLAPDVLAVCLLLLAVLALLDDRTATAAVLFALAVLTYEAVLVVGLAGALWWAWLGRPQRWRAGLTVLGAGAVAGAAVFLLSPKNDGSGRPFSHAGGLVSSHAGTGVFGPVTIIAVVLGMALLASVLWSFVAAFFPSYERLWTVRDDVACVGVIVLVLGSLPHLWAGFPFATDGIFDRGALVADLGTALVFGVALDRLFAAPRPWRVAIPALLLYLAALNGRDVHDYRAAERDGDALLAEVDHDLPTIPAGGVLVTPTLPDHHGVASFILTRDLRAALELRRDRWVAPIRVAVDAFDEEHANEQFAYDRTTGRLTRRRTTS